MATIGTLAVKLSANAQGLVAGLDKAGASVASFGKQALSLTGVGGAIKLALGGALAGGLALFITQSGAAIEQITALSRATGNSTEFISAMQAGVVALGGDTATASKAIQTLNDKILEANSGGSAAADVFNRLGVSAADLSRMKPDDAFRAVAEAISKIEDPTKRATLAVQLWGQDAGKLLPLLSQGAAGLDKAAAEAKRLGLSFSNLEGGKVEEASRAITTLQQTLAGVGRQIAIGVAPYVVAMAKSLDDMGANGLNVGKIVTTAFEYIAKGIGYSIDALRAMKLSFDFGVLGATALAYGVERVTLAGLRLEKQFSPALFDGLFDSMIDATNGALASLGESLDKQKLDISQAILRPSAVAEVETFFGKLRSQVDAYAAAQEKLKNAGGSVQAANALRNLAQEGNAAFTAARSPLQIFSDEMVKLNQLASIGAIGFDTYARSAAKAVGELEKANALGSVRLPSALTRNSSAAVSAVNQDERERELRGDRLNPQDRINRILTESQEIERQQLEQQRRIADAIGNAKVVQF